MSRRSVLSGVAVLFAVPLVMVATAPDALACSCATSGLSAQVDDSDVVFEGRVVARADRADTGTMSSVDPVTWTFSVDRVYKGTTREPQSVVSVREEASCGFEFEVGRAYLVLGDEVPGGDGSLETGLCHGTQGLAALSPADAETLGAGEAARAAVEPAVEPLPSAQQPRPGPGWQAVVAWLGALLVGGLMGAATWWHRRRRS